MSKSQFRGGTRLDISGDQDYAVRGSGSPKRKSVNKTKAARSFNHDASHTDAKNLAPPPMRGGWRL